jgi:quinolinate synthase
MWRDDEGKAELRRRIEAHKARLGRDLCILGHFYQQDEVIEFADFTGDSFMLAKAGADTSARYIVFCGVHFMAEASVILAKEDQRVFLPDMDAGCPLADFATIEQVERAWARLEKLGAAQGYVPIVYMNSSAAIKAFCGEREGLVCTSSSCAKAFRYAAARGKKVFFMPDENLGRNTARECGIDQSRVALCDPHLADCGLSDKTLASADVIVWRGHCHVHTLFTTDHVREMRKKYPGCEVVVHPECAPDVVLASDGAGSTAYLKDYAEKATPGRTVVIGTEINLVSRLARENRDKTILPLARSLCPNMFKTSLGDLCLVLDRLGEINEVFVEDRIVTPARLALNRMLKL